MNRPTARNGDGDGDGERILPGATGHRGSRRAFLFGLAGAGLSVPAGCAAPWAAAPARRIPRVGVLTASTVWLPALQQGLREHGYTEGQNLVVEVRDSAGQEGPLPDMAAELVGRPADVLVVAGFPAARAAIDATRSVPIVMVATGVDPVQGGLIAAYARPGGNVTGLTDIAEPLTAKRLERLREVLPGAGRVGVLWHPGGMSDGWWSQMQAAAERVGVAVDSLEVRGPEEFERAFAVAAERRVDAVFVMAGPVTVNFQARLGELSLQRRLPAIHTMRGFVEAGGLLTYGPNIRDLARRAAGYVDKILRGGRPADLPVEQPTTFDFVVNLRTAHALGLTIPNDVLEQATEVIR